MISFLVHAPNSLGKKRFTSSLGFGISFVVPSNQLRALEVPNCVSLASIVVDVEVSGDLAAVSKANDSLA